MPKWIEFALTCVGQKEVAGPASNGWIKSLWQSLKGGAWFWTQYGSDDSKLPWCGAWVAYCLNEVGIAYPPVYASALSWASFGEACGPAVGAIAVLTRNGGGHVAFVTGMSTDGRFIRLLGGNQGDAVNESWFTTDRVTAYRKPPGEELGITQYASVGSMSTSQA